MSRSRQEGIKKTGPQWRPGLPYITRRTLGSHSCGALSFRRRQLWYRQRGLASSVQPSVAQGRQKLGGHFYFDQVPDISTLG